MRKVGNWLKHSFIPHDGNEKQPHILRSKATTSFLVGSVLLEIIVLIALFPIFTKTLDFIASVLPGVLVDETNRTRAELSLNTLQVNPLLQEAAQLKANDMAARGYFAHNTPEGLQPWVFLDQVGYSYESAGENLAVNFTDSLATHEAWMNSPGHRANIVRNGFTEIGIATARGTYQGSNTIFVVQFFGRPANQIVVEAPRPTPVPITTPQIQEQVALVPSETPTVEEAASLPIPVAQQEVVTETIESEPEPQVEVVKEMVPEPESEVIVVLEQEEQEALLGVVLDSIGETVISIIDLLHRITIVLSGDTLAQQSAPIITDASVQGVETYTDTFVATGNIETVPVQAQGTSVFTPKASLLSYLVSSPRSFISLIFGVLAIIMAFALLLKVFIHIKSQYIHLILNGILVLLILVSFLAINHELSVYVGTVL